MRRLPTTSVSAPAIIRTPLGQHLASSGYSIRDCSSRTRNHDTSMASWWLACITWIIRPLEGADLDVAKVDGATEIL